jgi:hypothetical protein
MPVGVHPEGSIGPVVALLTLAIPRAPRWALMASAKLGHRLDWALPLERGRTV